MLSNRLLHYLLLAFLLFISCQNNQQKTTTNISSLVKKDTLAHHTDTSIRQNLPVSKWDTSKVRMKLNYGFSIVGNVVNRNGKKIYEDKEDTDVEYNHNTLHPLIRNLGDNTFELLLQYGTAPNMDLVQHFIIKNDKVIKLDLYPSFATEARNLGNDSLLDYAGLWDYRQTWGNENWDSACYEPIIFYAVQKNGIVLDSGLTIKINKRIYDKFYGFSINENIGFDNHKIKSKLDRAIDTLKMKFN
jgi:hypothetical protein